MEQPIAELIRVAQGIAHYKCLADRFHLFQQTIPDPFDPLAPPTQVECIHVHDVEVPM